MELSTSMSELDEIYAAHSARLVQLAFLITGSRMVAEELVQDAFERLALRWTTVASPPAWLRTVVVNAARSHGRRSRLERTKLVRHHEVIVVDIEVDDTWWRIRRLPARQRMALVLRYFEDLSLSESAAAMGISETAISSLLHRALKSLRKELL
jgi:RNA polymerase sigma factor (sigma-70 family)